MRKRICLGLLFLSITASTQLTGCGPTYRYTPVKGRITIQGKPAADVLVQFVPDITHETEGPESTGVTDKE